MSYPKHYDGNELFVPLEPACSYYKGFEGYLPAIPLLEKKEREGKKTDESGETADGTATETADGSATETTTETATETTTEKYLSITLIDSMSSSESRIYWRWPDKMATLVWSIINGLFERIIFAQRPAESCVFKDDSGNVMSLTKATAMDSSCLGETGKKLFEFYESAMSKLPLGDASSVRTHLPEIYELASRCVYDFLKKSTNKAVTVLDDKGNAVIKILPPTISLGKRASTYATYYDYIDDSVYTNYYPALYNDIEFGYTIYIGEHSSSSGETWGIETLAGLASAEVGQENFYPLQEILCTFYGELADYKSFGDGAHADVANYLFDIFGEDYWPVGTYRAKVKSTAKDTVTSCKFANWMECKYFGEEADGVKVVDSLLDIWFFRSLSQGEPSRVEREEKNLVGLIDKALYYAAAGKSRGVDEDSQKVREDLWDGGEIEGATNPPKFLISAMSYLRTGGNYNLNWRANGFLYAMQACALARFANWGVFEVPTYLGDAARLHVAGKHYSCTVGCTIGVQSIWFEGDGRKLDPIVSSFGFDEASTTPTETLHDNQAEWMYREYQEDVKTSGTAGDSSEGYCDLNPAIGYAYANWSGNDAVKKLFDVSEIKTCDPGDKSSLYKGIKYRVCEASAQRLMDEKILRNYYDVIWTYGGKGVTFPLAQISISIEGEFPDIPDAPASKAHTASTNFDMTGVELYGVRTSGLPGEPETVGNCYWTIPFWDEFALIEAETGQAKSSIKTFACKSAEGQVANADDAVSTCYAKIKEHFENNENNLWNQATCYLRNEYKTYGLVTDYTKFFTNLNDVKNRIGQQIAGKTSEELFKELKLTETFTNEGADTFAVVIVEENFDLADGSKSYKKGDTLCYLWGRSEPFDESWDGESVILHDDGEPTSWPCKYAYTLEAQVKTEVLQAIPSQLINYKATSTLQPMLGAFRHKWKNVTQLDS